MNEDPPGIQVNSNGPHKSVMELADAIKSERPETGTAMERAKGIEPSTLSLGS